MVLRRMRVALFGVVALAASLGAALAADVQYCTGRGVSRAVLAEYDRQILILGRDELLKAEEIHLPWGFPACPLRLFNPYYINCYDPDRRMPLWGAYRLRRTDIEAAEGKMRQESFRTDPRLLPDQTATCEDYKKHRDLATGGDPKKNYQARGHTVPDADFRGIDRAQAYTYYLSNMTPQWQLLNGGVWSTLEKYVRAWAKKYGAVYVITGSVFDRDEDGHPDSPDVAERMRPTRRVAVPSHYFKIVVREGTGSELETLAFLIPHWRQGRPSGPERTLEEVLREHLVAIRDIRQRIGLDLFPGLTGIRKRELEDAVASDLWPRN